MIKRCPEKSDLRYIKKCVFYMYVNVEVPEATCVLYVHICTELDRSTCSTSVVYFLVKKFICFLFLLYVLLLPLAPCARLPQFSTQDSSYFVLCDFDPPQVLRPPLITCPPSATTHYGFSNKGLLKYLESRQTRCLQRCPVSPNDSHPVPAFPCTRSAPPVTNLAPL